MDNSAHSKLKEKKESIWNVTVKNTKCPHRQLQWGELFCEITEDKCEQENCPKHTWELRVLDIGWKKK